MKLVRKTADLLIIGGGTAGCAAALAASEACPELRILIAEKADIRRSGCLAAGVNALNAYITEGHTPQDYVEYARKDAAGIVRDDLLLTMSEGLNRAAEKLEALGLVILKDENGRYVSRGWRNLKINGEPIKPLLAAAVQRRPNVEILNHLNVTDYLMDGRRVIGAAGFSVTEGTAYALTARAVLIATGGAAGLYRPDHPGRSRHKIWYPPFNTGAGYAMGIRAGAEMTTMEMRFVALRCKDTAAPVGTIAQGVGAKQINALGECYEGRYGLTTQERVYGTTQEIRQGRGPCFLQTEGIPKQQEEALLKAYLNMAPGQVLKWLESGEPPSKRNVEIAGTEPYIVGGHTASGYWVDTGRRTTLPGLYAAGDVAGGAPQKYVTGAMAEAEIAVRTILSDLPRLPAPSAETAGTQIGKLLQTWEAHLRAEADPSDRIRQTEEAMQQAMDEHAGGLQAQYCYSEKSLRLARQQIERYAALAETLPAADMYDLLRVSELKERLTVCRCLIAHLLARRETRWPGFGEYTDFPGRDGAGEYYVNSRTEDGETRIIFRDMVKEGRYEHPVSG